jgi:segregation and condensation protein A
MKWQARCAEPGCQDTNYSRIWSMDNDESTSPPPDDWSAPSRDDSPAAVLHIDIDGFEGPLDLLLALARTQKVDLTRLSVTSLVDQYLSYIAVAETMRLEVAADYLVMAAWLTFLKSRMLIPRDKIADDELSGEEMAQRLSFRLMRLEAMRAAAAQLMTRHRLGRDVFGRGNPEGTTTIRATQYTVSIYDLLSAYATQRVHTIRQVHQVKRRTVWSINDARRQLERLIGKTTGGWIQLDLFLLDYLPVEPTADGATTAATRRTVMAASFGATLELAREGLIDIRQDAVYAPIFMKKCDSVPDKSR